MGNNHSASTEPPLMSGKAALAKLEADSRIGDDSKLQGLLDEFRRNHAAYLLEYRKSDDETPEEERLHAAYWDAIDAMYDIPAASLVGLAAKATVIKEYKLESDAMDTLAQSLVDDCIALGASPRTHPDALLISLCDQFVARESHIRSLQDGGKSIEEFEVAVAGLEAQQDAVGKQIIEIHATTSDGAAARARAAVAWAPDMMNPELFNEGLSTDILRSLFRDLASLGAPASVSPDAEFVKTCDAQIAAYKAFNNDQFDSSVSPNWAEYARLDALIEAAHPTTLEGILALARVVDVSNEDDKPDSPDEVRAHYLVSLMAEFGGPAEPVEDPDAEIKTLAGEYEQVGRTIADGWASREGTDMTRADDDAWGAERAPLEGRLGELSEHLVNKSAITLAGIIAKTRALAAFESASAEPGGEGLRNISDNVSRAVIRDLIALGGGQ